MQVKSNSTTDFIGTWVRGGFFLPYVVVLVVAFNSHFRKNIGLCIHSLNKIIQNLFAYMYRFLFGERLIELPITQIGTSYQIS